MGIEIVIGVFTVASFVVGLIVPVLGWAWVSGRNHRLLLEGIEQDERFRVTRVDPGDAQTPVRFELRGPFPHEGRVEAITLTAQLRGTTPLWQITVARRAAGPTVCLVEQEWAEAGASRDARRLMELEAPLAIGRRGFRLYCDQADAALELLEAQATPVVAVLAKKPGIRELVLTPERLELVVGREGLLAEHAIAWLDDVVRLLRAVEGDAPAPLALLPGRLATGVGGSSVGIPGAPAAG